MFLEISNPKKYLKSLKERLKNLLVLSRKKTPKDIMDVIMENMERVIIKRKTSEDIMDITLDV